jgi:hypothetical protein
VRIDITDAAVERVIVTGHPNHELAIFGFVKRMRPRLLFLTDGGGAERENESRRALAEIGVGDQTRFLGWSERTLYEALLSRRVDVFRRLIDVVREHLIAIGARQVICESVELYNPLHDITLPVVRAAVRELADIELLEFPLIAQEPATTERYRVQRFAPAREAISIELTADELKAKLHARDHHYRTLASTMGRVLLNVPDHEVATEVFAGAASELPVPGRDAVLRYEWRGRLLLEQGDVDELITYADHFLPIVNDLLSTP